MRSGIIQAWCPKCEEETFPDDVELMLGCDPICSDCGEFYPNEIAEQIFQQVLEKRAKAEA
jgi:hypothetical protein